MKELLEDELFLETFAGIENSITHLINEENKQLNPNIVDSPFLWSGKKTKLMPQIKPLFPKCKVFVDLFGGSGSVTANAESDIVLYNDLFMGKLVKTINDTNVDEILNHVDTRIDEFNLSKTNKENYYIFKKTITENNNKDKSYYLDLFTISLFAFNGSLEFNMKKGLTSSFGKRNRRKVVEKTLREFKLSLNSKKQLRFFEKDYIDFSNDLKDKILNSNKITKDEVFIYADCPYSITRINGYKSDYNDGNLFALLDSFNKMGVKFAMSNVLSHKGKYNHELIEWSKKYNVHHLNFDYNNLNNTMKNEMDKTKKFETDEVLICNY